MSDDWQGVPLETDKNPENHETLGAGVPHSGDLGLEAPVTEFDKTSLQKAHDGGAFSAPDSPATLPEHMPPLTHVPVEVLPAPDSRGHKKVLLALGAAGTAAIAAVSGLLFLGNNDQETKRNPSVTTAAATDNSTHSTSTETTAPTDLDRERARAELRLAEPIYAFYQEFALPSEQDVMLLFRNIMMGDLTGDLKFFRASFGDDFDPYGNDQQWMVRGGQLQLLRDEYGEEVLPNIHYFYGPDNESSDPIIRDTVNDSAFYVYIKTTANSDNQYDTGQENYKIIYAYVGLKIEFSQDAGREIWTIDKLEPLNVVEDNT